jgi:hypothetical protein
MRMSGREAVCDGDEEGEGGGVRIEEAAIPPKEGETMDGEMGARRCDQRATGEGGEAGVEVGGAPAPPRGAGRGGIGGEEMGGADIRCGADDQIIRPPAVGQGERERGIGGERGGGCCGGAELTTNRDYGWERGREGEGYAERGDPIVEPVGPATRRAPARCSAAEVWGG